MMNPKIGRPKSENPRNIRLEIRLSKQEDEMLAECTKLLNTTKTDVIVQGIQMIKLKLDKNK